MSMLKDFADGYGVISGLSDHTKWVAQCFVATVLGAKIIKKYFILDGSIRWSICFFFYSMILIMEMVKAVREAESAIGVVDYSLTEK